MDHRDHYLVLGVARGEDPSAIRRAFKERALEHHPDRAGPEATERFARLAEAYRVLSDPGRRAAYDQALQRDELRGRSSPRASERSFGGLSFGPRGLSLFSDFHAPRSTIEEMFDRVLRNFTHRHVPKGERRQALDLEIALSRDEAELGEPFTLNVPVFVVCPVCDGTGVDWMLPCSACGQTGTLEQETPIELALTPPVEDGSVYEIDLDHLGIANLALRARFRVSAG